MKILKLFIGVSLLSSLVNAEQLDREMTQIAICSGILKGNSLIDYHSNNITKPEMLEALNFANYLYVEQILIKKPSKTAILQYDSLSASNTDRLSNAVNTETFGTSEFEEIISCYKKFSTLLLNKNNLDSKVKEITNKVSEENLHNIDVVLNK